jgi:hypothetical protein
VATGAATVQAIGALVGRASLLRRGLLGSVSEVRDPLTTIRGALRDHHE